MSDYFANALATAFPKAVERAQIAVVEVQSQFTKAGSYGGSRMWIEVESVYVAHIPQYAQTLISRLEQFDIKHTVVEAADFDAAVASVRAFAAECARLYVEKQKGGDAFGRKKQDFNPERLKRVIDEAVNEIEARKNVFESQQQAKATGGMTDTAAQAKHLTALAEEMRGVVPKFRTMFGTLQLETQDEANFLAMLADAQASTREYLGPNHEFTGQLATVAREIGESPSLAQVERAIATLQRASSYLTSRPRVPQNKSAIAATGMDALMAAASEEDRQAALQKTNFGDTRTAGEIELDALTKVYLGDTRVAPTAENEMTSQPKNKKVFLVHGHDTGTRDSVAFFLTKLGLEPIVLDEQPNRGLTIIEKFEAHSDVGFAVVLMTPDDEGRSHRDKAKSPKAKPQGRARQNVILEMGYFMHALGRHNVCGVTKGNIETPSDLSGVLVVSFDDADWKNRLAKELEASGYQIDWAGAGIVRA